MIKFFFLRNFDSKQLFVFALPFCLPHHLDPDLRPWQQKGSAGRWTLNIEHWTGVRARDVNSHKAQTVRCASDAV
ncbi:hypothetical protein I7I48_10683 [Histoplasma ohiense]|nr:hypothetical protein I7I48_10683 [Histoplasma ohiense (nom. inval.)]